MPKIKICFPHSRLIPLSHICLSQRTRTHQPLIPLSYICLSQRTRTHQALIPLSYICLLQRTRTHQPLNWFRTLKEYYYRDPWELYDLTRDPEERDNLLHGGGHSTVFWTLHKQLNRCCIYIGNDCCFGESLEYFVDGVI